MDLAIQDFLNIDYFSWVRSSFLPFVRILALIMVSHITGEREVPNRVKIGLAILIVIVLPLPKLDDNLTIYSLMGIWVIGQQIMIGIIIGYSVQITFMTVRFSGELIGMQMGLGMATVYDPVGGPSTSVLSRLINITALLVFLSLDGHLWLIYGLANSFTIIPISISPLKENGYLALIETTSLLFNNGVMLALPLLTLLLIINLSLGLLNRITPQLSIFVVGFPLTLLCGLMMLTYLFSVLPSFVELILEEIFSSMSRILLYLGEPSP